MRGGLQKLEWTLPVGAAMLLLAACGGTATSTPTAAAAVVVTSAAVEPTASVLVSGVVVDSANRPVANANVECMGKGVGCVAPGTQLIAQDGPDDGVNTRQNGGYAMVVTAPAGASAVMLNAHASKYELQMQQLRIPDGSCTADQTRCAVTVNFALRDQE